MIHKQELIAISQLIAKGYSIKDGLLLMDDKYHLIVEQLDKGQPFLDFIPLHKKQLFYQSLSFFLNITTLSEACLEAKEIEEMRKHMIEKMIKSMAYPLFVLVFSLVIFMVFEWLIYPQLNVLIDTGDQGILISLFFAFIHIFIFLIVLFCMSLLVISIGLLKNETFKLQFIEKITLKSSLYRQYCSYDFAMKIHILMRRGYSTKDTFYALKALKHEQYMYFICCRMIAQLESGYDFAQVVQNEKAFDEKFKYFFKLGYYAQTLESTLNDYIEYQQNRFQYRIKMISTFVCLIAYSLISILVVSIYQILLLPLNMLQ